MLSKREGRRSPSVRVRIRRGTSERFNPVIMWALRVRSFNAERPEPGYHRMKTRESPLRNSVRPGNSDVDRQVQPIERSQRSTAWSFQASAPVLRVGDFVSLDGTPRLVV